MTRCNQRRPLKFDDLRESVSEVHRLNTSGYDKAGNWNLGQACQHLSKTLRMSLEGSSFSLPFFLKPIARWLLFRSVMKGVPTRLSAKAPPQVRPDDNADAEHEVTEYETWVRKVLAEEASLLPDHPVFGRVTADEWRRFHAWHAAHHLSFLLPKTSATTAGQS